MKTLVPLIVGILSFLILYGVDYFDLKRKNTLKLLTWFIGIVLLLFSHMQVILNSKTFMIPEILREIGVVLSITFFSFLLYSVFIEIPILRKRGLTVNKNGLIVSGTYALSRHPGVLWYILTLISLFLSTGAKSLLIAIPIWSLMDILYALIQDYYFFPRLFGEDYYDEYRNITPMFIPSFKSIKAFLLSYKKIVLANNDQSAV